MALHWVKDRFWFPSGNGMTNFDGFLPVQHAVPVEGISSTGIFCQTDLMGIRNLALLGPPGSGKSEFLRRSHALLPNGATASQAFLDLAPFGSEDRFVAKLHELLDSSAADSVTGEVALVLDSFDEAQQRIPHLASLLISELENFPAEKLWLRIGCRTSEWPSLLDKWLTERSASLVAEFAPLRREDAKLASAALDDPEAFILSVESRGLAPLAAMPLSLDLLLRTYEAAGELPKSRIEVYGSGLLAMCDEQSAQRRFGRRMGPSPSEILRAGEIAAACMMFTVKERLWTGSIADAEATDLTVDDLVRFSGTDDEARNPDREAFVLLSQTALFHGAGAERQAWAHTTFLEYLAARWCTRHIQDRPRIQGLLFAPDQKIFPVMRRLAAWLISLDPASYAWIAEEDAESIASELDVPDDNLRSNVIDALVEHVKTGLHIRDWETNYSNLRYPGLGRQLQPAMTAGPEEVRMLAIQIATDGHAIDVQDDLLAIALNPAESERLRYRSILALRDWEWRGTELTALLDTPNLLGEDSRREIRGAIIDASWPHSLSTADALKSATVSAPEWVMGHYSIAIHRLAQGLTSRDVYAAAAWLQESVADSMWFEELRNAALAVCADRIDDVDVRGSAVSAVRRKLLRYEPVFGTLGLKQSWPVERRRALLVAVAQEASEEELFVLSDEKKGGLLHADDFPWLVEQIEELGVDEASPLVDIAHHMFNPDRFDHANTLAGLPSDHPLVTGPLASWCEVVELGSPRADELRQSWGRWHRPPETAPATVDPKDEIELWINSNLAGFDEGDLKSFEHALRLVTVPPGSKHFRSDYQPDLTKHPRWEELSQETRHALISRASEYLTSASCQPEIWNEPDLSTASSQAAYRSMVLLLRTGNGLDVLPAYIWKEWAPGIISWRPTLNGASEDDQEVLIAKAKPHAQDVLVRALLAVIQVDVSERLSPHVHRECSLLWNEDLSAGLLSLMQESPLEVSGEIAGILLIHDPASALPILHNWATQGSDEAAGLAVERLLAHDAVNSWPKIKEALIGNPSIAQKAVLSLANRERTDLDLNDEQLGFFHAWMEENFPRQDDPEVVGAHVITSREMVSRWRDRLLETLVSRGTHTAVGALRNFALLKPDETWRMSVLARALRSLREAAWEPMDLQTLSLFGRDRSKRLARTNHELAEVVQSALVAIQRKLIGETPESHLLWDTRVMRPKSEDEVSDYILHRLRDLIADVIINREVQVRRNSPSGIPERSDLLVEAAITDDPNLRVVVEVKGAWNRDLLTAIEAQLIGRYLHDYQPAEGIYLVLWPDAGSWDEGQGQSDRNRLLGLDRAATEVQLAQQAAAGIENGHVVTVTHLEIPYRRPTP